MCELSSYKKKYFFTHAACGLWLQHHKRTYLNELSSGRTYPPGFLRSKTFNCVKLFPYTTFISSAVIWTHLSFVWLTKFAPNGFPKTCWINWAQGFSALHYTYLSASLHRRQYSSVDLPHPSRKFQNWNWGKLSDSSVLSKNGSPVSTPSHRWRLRFSCQ